MIKITYPTHPKRGTYGQYVYYAYLPYYPKRYDVSFDLEEYRQIIYRFKNGDIGEETGRLMGWFIRELLQRIHLTIPINWWFCVIPASTERKTRARFRNFCKTVCDYTGLLNGYNIIYNTFDREAIHLTNNRVSPLSFINIREVSGKRIILFDDIITTGGSFTQTAEKLLDNGALEVIGLFLGQTCKISKTGAVEYAHLDKTGDESDELLERLKPKPNLDKLSDRWRYTDSSLIEKLREYQVYLLFGRGSEFYQ